MEIEILNQRENRLLQRTEVYFRVTHENASTPKRDEVRDLLSSKFNVKKDMVIVNNMCSDFGKWSTKGYAKIYTKKEDIMKLERKAILIRNGFLKKEDIKKKKKKKGKVGVVAPA